MKNRLSLCLMVPMFASLACSIQAGERGIPKEVRGFEGQVRGSMVSKGNLSRILSWAVGETRRPYGRSPRVGGKNYPGVGVI